MRTPIWKSLLTAAAIGVVIASLGYLSAGHISFSQRSIGDETISARAPIEFAGPVIQISPRIEITLPGTLRVSETRGISIVVGEDSYMHADNPMAGGPVSDVGPAVHNHMKSFYTVDISADEPAGLRCEGDKKRPFPKGSVSASVLWHCTISPKEPGEHLLDIGGLPIAEAGGKEHLSIADNGDKAHSSIRYDVLSDGTIELKIESLTANGLTAAQSAWVAMVNLLVGLIGSVLGYPFIKRYFENKANDPLAKTPEPSPSVPVTAESGPQKTSDAQPKPPKIERPRDQSNPAQGNPDLQ